MQSALANAAPAKRLAFLVNVKSGTGLGEEAARRLEARFGGDTSVDILRLAPGDDLARRVHDAVAAGAERIVAVGGDGTVCGVASALIGSDATLGVLPLGTFNFFARSLGIPEEIDAAIETALTGTARPVNLGEINGRFFINNASLGIYADILHQREETYRVWGRSRLAAYWSVLVAIATVYKPLTMRIEIDGREARARSPMAFVANSAYQLDEFELEGADAIRDDQFAVLLAPDSGRFMLIWRALLVAMRGVRRGRDFKLLTGRDILIETRRGHRLVARDGEKEVMEGPYRFRLLKDAIRVVVPG